MGVLRGGSVSVNVPGEQRDAAVVCRAGSPGGDALLQKGREPFAREVCFHSAGKGPDTIGNHSQMAVQAFSLRGKAGGKRGS